MIRQSSWDRGDLHKSARECWDYFVGLIIHPSNKDLTSAAECPQTVREGGLGSGSGRGGGGRGCGGGGGTAAIQYFEQVFRRTNGKDASQAISSIPNTSINKFSSEGD